MKSSTEGTSRTLTREDGRVGATTYMANQEVQERFGPSRRRGAAKEGSHGRGRGCGYEKRSAPLVNYVDPCLYEVGALRRCAAAFRLDVAGRSENHGDTVIVAETGKKLPV